MTAAPAAAAAVRSRRPRRRAPVQIPAVATKPMFAVLSDLPADESRYAFEFKWDGMRILSLWDGRTLTLLSRNGLDNTWVYPELQALGEALGDRPAVLDGEVCVLDANDRPSFTLLQQRMKADRVTALKRSKTLPVQYFLFDVLYLEGIVAKRVDSVYEPGRRSPSWLKIKIVQRQEFVVGGYTNEKGTSVRGGL